MSRDQRRKNCVSRRDFLKTIGLSPAFFLPAQFRASTFSVNVKKGLPFALVEGHLSPHYPSSSALDDLLRKIAPGSDEYITEKFAYEIQALVDDWGRQLKISGAEAAVASLFAAQLEASSLNAPAVEPVRSDASIHIVRRKFAELAATSRAAFAREMHAYFSSVGHIDTAEFLITAIDAVGSSTLFTVEVRYELIGSKDNTREQRAGFWRWKMMRDDSGKWQVRRWEWLGETVVQVRGSAFVDITQRTLGNIESYRTQLLRGSDYWRTVLDAACGIDVYGNNGIAAGDFDNDGFDDLYICQPSGLPNRLYRNRGDGTFDDVTDAAGVAVLDGTACALFADFQNRGLQDLLVVCANGPLLFVNQGNSMFKLKQDAFKFAEPPQGTFTHAAVADYDADGRLDIYFCLYSYYLGLDQYHYPAPYFDARNGPPNFLFHNEGDGTFVDRTKAAGLNAENDRYSFACAWGDMNGNGHPDLYVANDFGRNNLYRNNGDGTFAAISAEAHVQDVGAGMSATWLDVANSGKQDIYVSNMWSAAGLRISEQAAFHAKDSSEIRALYRQHARGNSLYRNLGSGKFENASDRVGIGNGRWAWSSDSWDFDHDGYPDLYIANGYISGPDERDLSSFFWRHVVGKSPANSSPSPSYERGWNAINESIRSDLSWSGRERNICYLNNGDGTFSEVSRAVGLDAIDDSRSFALADIDHDGRLEVILKNRTAPQLRVFRNELKDIGSSVSFRLHGEKSNRDAIGAAVTVGAGALRQTKYIQAGSGFLSQHSKELFFGLGQSKEADRAAVRWPSGLTQTFEKLPANHRIEIHEGSADFRSIPFVNARIGDSRPRETSMPDALPTTLNTWLIQPLQAPNFSLPDAAGTARTLQSFQGKPLLLCFWTMALASSKEQLLLLRKHYSEVNAAGLTVVALNVDDATPQKSVPQFLSGNSVRFPRLLATPEVAGIYNIIYRYLFDRRRDLPVPSSFLIDETGKIIKLYQGVVQADALLADLEHLPQTAEERIRKALPFSGLIPEEGFQRNDFTYGVALFQHGYLDQAAESFQQVIAAKPNNGEAYYNLGTLYLRRQANRDAREYLSRAVELRPAYPEAWNNLAMLSAQEGQTDEAVREFQKALELRPTYTVALLNLGKIPKLTTTSECCTRDGSSFRLLCNISRKPSP
jgi:peroxiredoxin